METMTPPGASELRATLTEQQRRILDHLIGSTSRNFFQPTTREIAAEFGFSSQNAVNNHLKALHRKGLIDLALNKSRAIAILHREGLSLETTGYDAEPNAPLTEKQRAIFNFMVEATARDFYQPSVREIGESFERTSAAALMGHLKALDRKGLLDLGAGRGRAIRFHRRRPLD